MFNLFKRYDDELEPDTAILIDVDEYAELLETKGKFEALRAVVVNTNKYGPIVCPICRGESEYEEHPNRNGTHCKVCIVCGRVFMVDEEDKKDGEEV